jgi:hypothetical protein
VNGERVEATLRARYGGASLDGNGRADAARPELGEQGDGHNHAAASLPCTRSAFLRLIRRFQERFAVVPVLVLRRHATEPGEFRIAGTVNLDRAAIAVSPYGLERCIRSLENSIALATPSVEDVITKRPADTQINDERRFRLCRSRDNQHALNATAAADARAQVGFL